jgi:hypothetical protein
MAPYSGGSDQTVISKKARYTDAWLCSHSGAAEGKGDIVSPGTCHCCFLTKSRLRVWEDLYRSHLLFGKSRPCAGKSSLRGGKGSP